MTTPDPLFREEALREFVATRVEGRLLRISPRWTAWLYWLLLAVFLGAALFAALVPVDHWIGGRARIKGDSGILAAFPAQARHLLQPGATLELRFVQQRARVERIVAESISPARLRGSEPELVPEEDAGGSLCVVEASFDLAPPAAENYGRAEIFSRRATILSLLLDGSR